MTRILKSFALLAILALTTMTMTSCGVTVPPGYEGIKVKNIGKDRGVQDSSATTGWVTYGFQEHVEKYPNHWVNYFYSDNPKEGKVENQAIQFNADRGITLRANVGIFVRVRRGLSPGLYRDYTLNMDEMIQGPVYNFLRDELNREAGVMPVLDILGGRKAALLDSVKGDMNRCPLGKYLEFDEVSFLSPPEPVNRDVRASLDNVTKSMYYAQSQKLLADGKAATARGDSAQSIIQANGKAEANNRLSASLTDKVLAWKFYESWDGHLSVVNGGSTLTQIPPQVFAERPPKK